MRQSLAVILFFSASLRLCGELHAADWPQWRGPQRTGHVAEGVPVPTSLPAEPKVLWHIPIGEGFASPVVAAERVFYLDHQAGQEVVHAADAKTGKELWKADLDKAAKDNFGIGPRCAPVFDNDLIFAVSLRGELKCLKAADGSLVWHTNYVTDFGAQYLGTQTQASAGASRYGNTASPIVDGENLFAQVGSPKGAGLVCFKKATGEVVWKSQNDPAGYACPFIATIAGRKQFLSFTVNGLVSVDTANGNELWRVPLRTDFGRHVTTPLVVGDIVFVASNAVGLVATKVTAQGCQPAWTSKELKVNYCSPVAVDGFVYSVGMAKNVFCAEAASGKPAWSKLGLIQTAPDRAYASFVVMGKNILMLTDTGQLILFAADPKEYRELGRAQVCGATLCNPAYVDGKLYLRDAKELICLQLLP
ncbi:MAG TPA: PQQ-binding-like beta-propeller repeat protein [Planctomycetota bacterium]|jgi:hypothetical protein